jgi:hypothetical protein
MIFGDIDRKRESGVEWSKWKNMVDIYRFI